MANEQRFVDSEAIETVQLDWGTLKWMNTPETTGAAAFSAGMVVLEPGKGHERHTHPDSEEVLYVLSGEGTQTVAEDEREVSSGDMIYIPAGVEHSTVNSSWEPLRFLAMYGPPGPEAEIRDSFEATVLPPGEVPE
ncbi:cupin domain-containing protein [Halococcus sp. IIIV-5B]|uniref:cupin domain-containing protein n=1 Tax=Halococcus sp. IIIV-5B TaxID=2321230 RepID=UPI000E75F2B2|nr:cupin domain-containing protein [Halococcus sp. IIIV-5B]RJT07958.1 cupin domain-containing protein [Halococcus sp. IIIV-5B]